MKALHAVVAVFGSIDRIVEQNRQQIATAVERFLPHTTATGERGWSTEIEQLVTRLSADGHADFPDLGSALDGLAKTAVGSDTDPDVLNPTQLARLIYAIGVLAALRPELDEDGVGATDEQLALVLALAAPETIGAEVPSADIARQRGYELLGLIRDEFTHRGQWNELMDHALARELVSEDLAAAGPPCTGSVRRVGGQYCTRLITDFRLPDVSMDQVKPMLDPLNWDRVSSFFCRMTELDPPVNQFGWSRVLEEVSTDPARFRLTTAVKYWKADVNGGAVVNYDLDDDRANTDDCGLVLLDRGYIWVTPLSTGGCRVRSSKEVLIEGLSATATAVWACVAGWGDAQIAALNSARELAATDLVGWRPSRCSGPLYRDPIATPRRSRPPRMPDGARSYLVPRTVEAMTGLIDGVAARGTIGSRDRLGGASDE